MIELDDIRVGIATENAWLRVIDGLSLAIARGETFALVGESGCGKSMTALALMRLLPEGGAIDAGRVVLGGQDLVELPEAAMRSVRGRRIGMIFQEPATSLNPVTRVGDQIVEAIETHTALRGGAARERAVEWLRRVGIPEPERRIDDYPFRMSGGQKQRVMIAMTLACEPDFLIADEPTTALDVTIQAQILQLLKQLQKEQGLGLLLITHDLAVVSGMAHRVALMYAGQIVEVAEASEFFRSPRHPYSRALLRALPDAATRGRALEAIAGTVPAAGEVFNGCRFAPRCAFAFDACRRTPPELVRADGASVRCLLYRDGERAGESAAAAKPAADAGRVGDGGRAAPSQPLLDVQRLRVGFPLRKGLLHRVTGEFVAVDDVSFEIGRARTLALVGESGCGKTTIGKAIVQLLRGQANVNGRALLEGQDLFALQGDALRRVRADIQLVFQDPFASLDPRMRVNDILEEGLLALRPEMDAAARAARLKEMIERVGLRADALQRYPHEFSGGQRQRLAIARALAVGPKLLICDEPTSALDVSVQAQILNLLAELQRSMGVSYLFITHKIGVVEYLADDVVVMQAGRVAEQGAAQDVLYRPQAAYTKTLLAAVPRLQILGGDSSPN
ncbi:MAG: dipeptide ABC transporter ATP-binding protein [Burkholderiales bacterium]|nr:MAG: dipeptide ABC transporter ATP-binding protein [Burkholderiales bacterium]